MALPQWVMVGLPSWSSDAKSASVKVWSGCGCVCGKRRIGMGGFTLMMGCPGKGPMPNSETLKHSETLKPDSLFLIFD